MTGSVRELERKIYLNTLAHGGNPVMRWMCSNITIEMDPSGNVKFNKAKLKEGGTQKVNDVLIRYHPNPW